MVYETGSKCNALSLASHIITNNIRMSDYLHIIIIYPVCSANCLIFFNLYLGLFIYFRISEFSSAALLTSGNLRAFKRARQKFLTMESAFSTQ